MTMTYDDLWHWSPAMRLDNAAGMDHAHRFVMLDPTTEQVLEPVRTDSDRLKETYDTRERTDT